MRELVFYVLVGVIALGGLVYLALGWLLLDAWLSVLLVAGIVYLFLSAIWWALREAIRESRGESTTLFEGREDS